MRIKVAPTKLDVDPVLARGAAVKRVARFGEERGFADVPLVRSKEEDLVRTDVTS